MSLVEAGLTPQQALQTSIINGPKFFELEKYYASVDSGKIADLLILEKNPLREIENIRSIAAVIARGKVYTKAALIETIQLLKQ